MFGKRITLFRILGFEVHLDLSWLVLALLVTWSLAAGLFPSSFEGLPTVVYWAMAVVGALGLFASILFHEFSHSLVARRFGLPMKGITLFIFGGVAEMSDEPPSPRAEFLIAIAGPLSSVFLGFIFYIVAMTVAFPISTTLPRMAFSGVFGYLALINWILAAFNLLPAFPLDGGRVLRATLWHFKKDLAAATRISARIGSGFGLVIILLGVANVLFGNLIGGLWQIMIGMFLRSAARMSYQQVIVRQSLAGEPVSRFMNSAPVTVPATTTIKDLVENYFYRYHFKMLPVKQGEKLLGCIDSAKVKNIPRQEWLRTTVGESMDSCAAENSITPETAAMQALSIMNQTRKSRLMVVDDGGKLVGILSIRDLMGYLSAKMELEGNTQKRDEQKKAA